MVAFLVNPREAMSPLHQQLAAGRWQTLSLVAGWSFSALTIADPQHRRRLKELTRVRELLLDYFWGGN